MDRLTLGREIATHPDHMPLDGMRYFGPEVWQTMRVSCYLDSALAAKRIAEDGWVLDLGDVLTQRSMRGEIEALRAARGETTPLVLQGWVEMWCELGREVLYEYGLRGGTDDQG